jgi:hypothetical protein
MNFELEIVNKLKEEERHLERLDTEKKNAKVISEEKSLLLQYENKKAYIRGMRDALLIMQKNQ